MTERECQCSSLATPSYNAANDINDEQRNQAGREYPA